MSKNFSILMYELSFRQALMLSPRGLHHDRIVLLIFQPSTRILECIKNVINFFFYHHFCHATPKWIFRTHNKDSRAEIAVKGCAVIKISFEIYKNYRQRPIIYRYFDLFACAIPVELFLYLIRHCRWNLNNLDSNRKNPLNFASQSERQAGDIFWNKERNVVFPHKLYYAQSRFTV